MADKGAGIVILNFNDYMKACYEHLLANIPNKNNPPEDPKINFEPVNEFALKNAKIQIQVTLKEALEEKLIAKDEFNAMNPDEKKPIQVLLHFKSTEGNQA